MASLHETHRPLSPADEIDFKEAATPHDVCGALKHYFRESPEPLIPYENHSAFVAAGRTLGIPQVDDGPLICSAWQRWMMKESALMPLRPPCSTCQKITNA